MCIINLHYRVRCRGGYGIFPRQGARLHRKVYFLRPRGQKGVTGLGGVDFLAPHLTYPPLVRCSEVSINSNKIIYLPFCHNFSREHINILPPNPRCRHSAIFNLYKYHIYNIFIQFMYIHVLNDVDHRQMGLNAMLPVCKVISTCTGTAGLLPAATELSLGGGRQNSRAGPGEKSTKALCAIQKIRVEL